VKIGFKKRAKISSVQISTKWFTGNQARAVSVVMIDELSKQEVEVLSRVSLQPDQEHTFTFPEIIATECFIKIFYEGGISRINFFGEVAEKQLPIRKNLLENASISHVSNDHYGNPKMAVQGSRKEMHMVGWESARTGYGEQAIFHFEQPTHINEIVVDTYLHRFNSPLTCHVFGLLLEEGKNLESYLPTLPKWMLQFEDAVLPHENLEPDTYHRFTSLKENGPFSHLLYLHYPNGGIHGLKCF